jgi:hypothetical protein
MHTLFIKSQMKIMFTWVKGFLNRLICASFRPKGPHISSDWQVFIGFHIKAHYINEILRNDLENFNLNSY